jgi:hypothetical protein
VLGLSIGIAAVALIFLIADFENSFDKFHSGDEQIFRVVSKEDLANKEVFNAAVPYPLARFFRAEYAGAQATQTHFVQEGNVRIGKGTPFQEENILFADSLFFRVLDFADIKKFWVMGNPSTALMEPRKAVLTESTAKKYFGNTNPIGQLIRLDNRIDVEVTGIVKDVPATSHLPFNMVVSFSSLVPEMNAGLGFNNWGVVSTGYSYVRMNKPTAVKEAEKALYNIVQKQGDDGRERRTKMFLQPLSNVHFNPTYEESNPSYTVSSKYLTMLFLLAGFILLIACVNYINLSTSFAFAKSKEVGIRKTIGASKMQLFFHYMQETLFVTTLATIIGITIALLLLPVVNQMLDKGLTARQLLNPSFFASGVSLLLFFFNWK